MQQIVRFIACVPPQQVPSHRRTVIGVGVADVLPGGSRHGTRRFLWARRTVSLVQSQQQDEK
ncbi:MAG: hypothetical protein MI741_11245, partial [Rhodospirillales bacterium]|nr:hypothetical protein [Rhodospirillales bacterium]